MNLYNRAGRRGWIGKEVDVFEGVGFISHDYLQACRTSRSFPKRSSSKSDQTAHRGVLDLIPIKSLLIAASWAGIRLSRSQSAMVGEDVDKGLGKGFFLSEDGASALDASKAS